MTTNEATTASNTLHLSCCNNDSHNSSIVVGKYDSNAVSPIGVLTDFLEECAKNYNADNWPRKRCTNCHASRVMYCPDCVTILIDDDIIEASKQSNSNNNTVGNDNKDSNANFYKPLSVLTSSSFNLPFHVDFILDDRRTSATSIAVVALLKACSKYRNQNKVTDISANSINNQCDDWNSAVIGSKIVRLIDCTDDDNKNNSNNDDVVPDYGLPEYNTSNSNGTVLLFPDETSVPLSSVCFKTNVDRIVLLDCKWSRPSIKTHPHLLKLQKVHLDDPPDKSFFWRWHNSGSGMLSTVEALYYAAWQVTKQRQELNQSLTVENKDSTTELSSLVNMLWLFGVQRETIRLRYEKEAGKTYPPYMPFTEDGKEYQRSLRKKRTQEEKKKFKAEIALLYKI